jgi:DNA-binding MarR family transcriptional regulator
MNKTAELVNMWAKFEVEHPNSEITDFCQYHLIREREKKEQESGLGGIVPPDLYSKMAKMVGRITKLHISYANNALKDCGINSFDEFLYLNTIRNSKSPHKTEVIYSNFNELSSGLLILKRLKKRGLLSEMDDEKDKRVKRLSLTQKGNKTIMNCYEKLQQVNEMFFNSIPDTDIELCLQLLKPLEIRFSSLWIEHKEKDFEEIHDSLK